MTYFGFLLRFLIVPLGVLLAVLAALRVCGRSRAERFQGSSALMAFAVTSLIAVIYTTPWDNYLVASGVWNYDPSLVAGVILGYVPLEEYLFFVLQTALTASFLAVLAHREATAPASLSGGSLRRNASLVGGLVWLGAVVALAVGWSAGRYLGLLLAWGIPPIVLQLGFGADLLWEERRLLLPAILAPTVFLSLADVLAVSAGTWQFNPEMILGFHVGPLPIEESAFFLVTNTLISFSTSLLLSAKSRARFLQILGSLRNPDGVSRTAADEERIR